MIIVTGTKRSGTSMWMQLLKAAGFPPIGDAFPRNWETTIHEANPGGFWESELRRGIYYQTNPDPKSGAYLFPDQTRRHAVKVFIPGLIKTDLAFVDRVIATIRPWRHYVRSVERLYQMEHEAKESARKEGDAAPLRPVTMPPVIEWWVENFSLISDIVTRRYPFYMVAFDSVLGAPDATLRPVFEWLGDGDAGAAIKEVQPALRTQDGEPEDATAVGDFDLAPEVIEVFDALYDLVQQQRPLDQPFVDRLNQTNELLSERIQTAVRELRQRHLERQQLLKERRRLAKQANEVGEQSADD